MNSLDFGGHDEPPCPFPFWVVTEQKGNEVDGREVTVSLAIFNLAEQNLHPRPCPQYNIFVLKGDVNLPSSNQPTNQRTITVFYAEAS